MCVKQGPLLSCNFQEETLEAKPLVCVASSAETVQLPGVAFGDKHGPETEGCLRLHHSVQRQPLQRVLLALSNVGKQSVPLIHQQGRRSDSIGPDTGKNNKHGRWSKIEQVDNPKTAKGDRGDTSKVGSEGGQLWQAVDGRAMPQALFREPFHL